MTTDRVAAETIYRTLLRSRLLEVALIEAVARGQPAHVGHPASGQEGVAAGVCAALHRADRLYCSHRVKHWAIAKGCDLRGVAAEYWGKATGLAGGWGGEMRMMDETVGFMGSNHVVGSALPVAVGAALAAKRDGRGNIAVVAFGDGASVQGTFHEALNLAATWHVPVLFICENNLYAESTPVEYHSRPSEIYRKALAYEISAIQVDGQDALGVYETVRAVINEMRADGSPRFVEALTYRYLGHFYGDKTTRYRSAAEEAAWLARDPIDIFEQRAGAHVLSPDALTRLRTEVISEVDLAMDLAERAPYPNLAELHLSAYVKD